MFEPNILTSSKLTDILITMKHTLCSKVSKEEVNCSYQDSLVLQTQVCSLNTFSYFVWILEITPQIHSGGGACNHRLTLTWITRRLHNSIHHFCACRLSTSCINLFLLLWLLFFLLWFCLINITRLVMDACHVVVHERLQMRNCSCIRRCSAYVRHFSQYSQSQDSHHNIKLFKAKSSPVKVWMYIYLSVRCSISTTDQNNTFPISTKLVTESNITCWTNHIPHHAARRAAVDHTTVLYQWAHFKMFSGLLLDLKTSFTLHQM